MAGQEWGNVSYSNIKLIVDYTPNEIIVPSQASVARVNVGEAQTVVISNDSEKVSHIVKWSYQGINSNGQTIAIEETKNLSAAIRSTSWAVPEENVADIYRKFPSATVATGTLYLTTKNGSDIVGQGNREFSAQLLLPESAVGPQFESTPLTITSSNSSVPYLQNNATLTVVPHVSARYGAQIVKIQISTPDYVAEVSQSSASFQFPLKTEGSYPITVSATDSRGYTVSYTDSSTVNVVPCTTPVFSTLEVARCDQSGNVDDEKQYAKITVSASAVIGSNSSVSMSYNVKAYESTSSYLYNEANFTSSPYIFGSDTYPFEADKSYLLRITATATGVVDGQNVSTQNTVDAYINTQTYTFYRLAGGKGVAFGDVARRFGVEVKDGWPFYTHGKEIMELLIDVAHPVGSIVEVFDSSFDPNEEWPWTRWSLIPDGYINHLTGGQVQADIPINIWSRIQ